VNHFLVEIGAHKFLLAMVMCVSSATVGLVLQSEWPRSQRDPSASGERQPQQNAAGFDHVQKFESDELSEFSRVAASAALPGSSVRVDDVQILAAQILDSKLPLKVRRQTAWNLAKFRSPEAVALLRKAFVNAPVQLQMTIAEALGMSELPEVRDMLRELINGNNAEVVRGALRGWAALGDEEALQVLAKVLSDPKRGGNLRREAALGLATLNNTRAYQILTDAFNRSPDGEFAESLLGALGQRSFVETEPFFRAFLGRSDLSADLRVAALEALAEAPGDPSALLMQHLQNDNSDVRAAAAWALSMLDTPPNLASQLLKQLEREQNVEVRTRMYQALENDTSVDWKTLLATVRDDASTSSRLAGLKLLAAQVSRQNSHAFAVEFDLTAVPQLENAALTGRDVQNRMLAVIALKQARTPGAEHALNKIANQSTEPKIASAAKAR